MKEVLKSLLERRSCRKYRPDPVPKELLDQVLEAGTYAATGMGKQSPIMIAVTDRETRDRLSRMNAAVMGSDQDPFYGAPAVIVVLADRNIPTYLYDGSLVMGNMLLAAHSLGLGGIWIHRAKEEFETAEWQEVLKSLGVEGEWEGIGHCAVGFTDGEIPAAAPRKEGRVFWAE